jgi:hypothetical protein
VCHGVTQLGFANRWSCCGGALWSAKRAACDGLSYSGSPPGRISELRVLRTHFAIVSANSVVSRRNKFEMRARKQGYILILISIVSQRLYNRDVSFGKKRQRFYTVRMIGHQHFYAQPLTMASKTLLILWLNSHIFHCPSTIFKGRALVPLLATFTYTDHRLHYYHQHSAYASAPQPLQARYLLHRFFNNESTTADQLLSDWSAIHCEPAGERLQLRKAQYDVVQQQLHATPCCALPNAVQSTAEIPWTGASSLFGCPSEPIWDGAASRARPVPSRPHLCKVCGAIGPTAAAYR